MPWSAKGLHAFRNGAQVLNPTWRRKASHRLIYASQPQYRFSSSSSDGPPRKEPDAEESVASGQPRQPSPSQCDLSRQSIRCDDHAVSPLNTIQLLSKDKQEDISPLLTTSFSHLQKSYQSPAHPIVLAHGLLGFDELRLGVAGRYLPPVHYWRGIKSAFASHGIESISTAVPSTGSIPVRAEALYSQIADQLRGRTVNIVAHSMGGLDARWLISRLCPPASDFTVASLTTIATPHRGSSTADMVFRDIGPDLLPRLYSILDKLGLTTDAFSQLTTSHVTQHFNPVVPNSASVRYFSYGASATPHLFSVFRVSHDLMNEIEGPNDGLVSVRSAKWGQYKGTLVGVTHLDLINWTNRIKHAAAKLGLVEQKFNAQAFYLGVADMLAKEGL